MSKENAKLAMLVTSIAKKHKLKIVPEYMGIPNRRFRFDFAIPEKMIAIEYEGTMSEKSRHTSITGYSKDCVKYNLAVINGWRVLRYTAINYGNVSEDLTNLLLKQ